MLNITACLAIRTAHIPDWNFDWSDTQPQRSQQSLTINDFLPNEEDAEQLRKRAIRYLTEILVSEFKSLSPLQSLLPLVTRTAPSSPEIRGCPDESSIQG